MRTSRGWIGVFTLTLLMGAGSALPVAARQGTPAASPAAPSSDLARLGWQAVEQRQLTVDGEVVAISPDGRWLAGVRGAAQFCIWDIGTLQPSCDDRYLPVYPDTIIWAPDSSAVAFSLLPAMADSDLYLFEVDAKALRNLTDDGLEETAEVALADEPVAIDIFPAWSPDARELAFARTTLTADEPGATSIMRIGREGGAPREVVFLGPPEPYLILSSMHWLTDDTLLFAIERSAPPFQQDGIWRIGVDGDDPRQVLTPRTVPEMARPRIADVTPDSRTASVYSQAKVAQGLLVDDAFALLDLTSGKLAPVVPAVDATAYVITPPRFSPDGASAVFSVAMETTTQQTTPLVVMDITTGDQATVVPYLVPASTMQHSGFQWVADDTIFGLVTVKTPVTVSTPVLLTLVPVGGT